MPRPLLHDPDEVLDAARDLIVEGGPRAAGIRAIAERSGAPSGSLYHRFGSRDELVARAWLRAVRRFQAGYVAALDAAVAQDAAAPGGAAPTPHAAGPATGPRAGRAAATPPAGDAVRASTPPAAAGDAVRWAVAFALEQPADAHVLLRYGRHELLDAEPGADLAA